jgi:hypothetical protein
MEEIVRFLHSWTRWLVLIAALVAVVYMLIGLVRGRSYDRATRRIMTIFSSLVGLQWIIGIVLLLLMGSLTGFGLRHYWEHLIVQTVALGVAHLHLRWKSATTTRPYINNLVLVAAVAALIVVGILVLPQGIQWRLYGV